MDTATNGEGGRRAGFPAHGYRSGLHVWVLCMMGLAVMIPAAAWAGDIPTAFLSVEPEEYVEPEKCVEPEDLWVVESDEAYAVTASAEETVRAVSPLYQADYPDALFSYRGVEKSVASSGCGAVCLSMVLSYFDDTLEQTPETIFTWLYRQGLYRGNGFSKLMMCTVLEDCRMQYSLCSLNRKTMRQALESGSLVIAFMGQGYFSDNGHYILIYAIDESNKILVIDPNSPEKSDRAYNISWLMRQASGSEPYIVCSGAVS